MNISYNWLRRYVDCKQAPKELAAALTSIGLECDTVEEVESIRGGLRGVVIGKVLTCTEHPDSDHLHVTTVDLGLAEGPVQIVCGAPNVAAGQTVVVATVGTTLYDGDKELKIKKSKIRGVESFGMICAEDEIGVGSSHDGIIVIDRQVAPGTPAAQYFGLESDYVLEVDLTPNRIDGASHYGVARDWAAWAAQNATAVELHRPDVSAFATDRPDGGLSVEVADAADCPRYCGLTIRGVKVGESPKWLRDSLTAIGQRPINAVVDVTNYLLHSFCQPLHCFDVAKVKGGRVIVKTLAEGTPFVTLDGVERKLNERDLMICNAEEPMCLAGVFGGLDSGVTTEATDIFLESACFNPTTIRKAARRHGLNTDASFRYERGVDPNGCLYVLKLAALMIKEMCGGEICGPVVDLYPTPVLPYPVELSMAQITGLIGKEIPADTVKSILRSLEIEIESESADGTMKLLVPTYRVDVRRPCDVIEEILRIFGYNNVEIPSEVNSSLSYDTATDADNALTESILNQLAGQGFYEIMNNSLTAASYYEPLTTYPADHCVRLLNPLSGDLSVMRQTLLFGGLESIAHNLNRRAEQLMMVETGNVYFRNPDAESTAAQPLAPYSEHKRLALWLCGNVRPASWLAPAEAATPWHLTAAVQAIMQRLGISAKEYTLTPDDTHADLFGQALVLATRSGKQLGILGTVAPALLKRMDISRDVMFAELQWDTICAMARDRHVTFSPLSKTQPVRRDLALLLDSAVTFAQVQATVAAADRKLLRSVELFDVYEGKNLPQGKKSYAIAITLQDDERTLQDKQIDAVMQKVIRSLTEKLGAELR